MYRLDKKRFFTMLLAVLFMGFFLSFLLKTNYGTDPCSFMNASISSYFGISLGNTMVIVNSILFILEFAFARNHINWGTFANMFLLGYAADFTTYVFDNVIPSEFYTAQPSRVIVFAIALIGFLTSAAIYMNANLGLSPFDAIPKFIASSLKAPFYVVRMLWDFSAILIGFLLGGRVTIASVILAFTVGPAVSFIGKRIKI